jgi:hypothetical protein
VDALEKTTSCGCDLALWCNWLTRRPLKAESPGSSPGNATNPFNQLDRFWYFVQIRGNAVVTMGHELA